METGKPITSSVVIKDFKDLEVWQPARLLQQRIWALARSFPSEERTVLSSQIRRAAISVTANIAEGFGRYSYQENIQFCRQARGSLFEVRDHPTTALDASYLSQQEYEELDQLAQTVARLLNGYIRSTSLRLRTKRQQQT